MLKIKNYLDKSPIHGMGVFAGENIKKDTIIWTMVEGFDQALDDDTIRILPRAAKEYIETYGFRQNGFGILSGDNDRFTNHSDTPNARLAANGDMVAVRDIARGEELTSDYREIYENWRERIGLPKAA